MEEKKEGEGELTDEKNGPLEITKSESIVRPTKSGLRS